MLIYRLLHVNDGLGPYNIRPIDPPFVAKAVKRVGDRYWHKAHVQPQPYEDALRYPNHEHEVFGFCSLDDMRRWFGKQLSGILRDGWVIAVYDATPLAIGDSRQVIFDIREARYVKTLDNHPLFG